MDSDLLNTPGTPDGDACRHSLPQALADKIADMALVSEEYASVAEGCHLTDRLLASYATASSDFSLAVSALRRKLAELSELQQKAASGVMHCSILIEEAADLAQHARRIT